jgi:hypothetical protein
MLDANDTSQRPKILAQRILDEPEFQIRDPFHTNSKYIYGVVCKQLTSMDPM